MPHAHTYMQKNVRHVLNNLSFSKGLYKTLQTDWYVIAQK